MSPAASRSGRRGRAWAIAGLVLAMVASVCSEVDDRPAPSIPDPDTSAMAPPVARAIREAREGVIRRIDSAAAWGQLGSVLDAHELYPLAEVCYRQAAQLAPRHHRWPYLLGTIQDFQGAPIEALSASFEEALRLSGPNATISFRHGDALMRWGRLDEALAAFSDALSEDPDLALARRSLGQALTTQGRPEEAKQALEHARRLSPDDPVVVRSLARALAMLGEAERAEELLQQAGGLTGSSPLDDPDRARVESMAVDPQSCADRANALMARNDFSAALVQLRLFEEAQPDHAVSQFQLGICYGRTGDRDRARRHLERSVELDGDLAFAHFVLASMLQEDGDLPGCLEHVRAAVRAEPGDPRYRLALADILARTGDAEGAAAERRIAAELTPQGN